MITSSLTNRIVPMIKEVSPRVQQLINQLINGIGQFGLFLFVFSVFFKERSFWYGVIFMGLAFILKLRPLKILIRDPLFIFGLIFFFFVSIRGVDAIIEFADYRDRILDRIFLYGCIFLLVFLVAFWMNEAKDKWHWFVFALLAGFLMEIIKRYEWANYAQEFLLYWTGAKRAGFGATVNRFGLWSAIIFLGCVLLYKRVWGCSEDKFGYVIRILFWFMMCSVSAMGIVFSQSRAAWLASALIIPLFFFYQSYRAKRLKLKAIVFLAVFFIGISLLTNLPGSIEQRIISDMDGIEKLLNGTMDSEPAAMSGGIKSVDIRLQMYSFFWEKWKERPLFGYGPWVSEIMIKAANDEYREISHYDHFHNLALDLLIQLGTVGLALFIGCFFIIIRQLVLGKQRGEVDLDYYLFVLGGLALIFISAQFHQPFNSIKGLRAVGLLGGIGYASAFKRFDLDLSLAAGKAPDS